MSFIFDRPTYATKYIDNGVLPKKLREREGKKEKLFSIIEVHVTSIGIGHDEQKQA